MFTRPTTTTPPLTHPPTTTPQSPPAPARRATGPKTPEGKARSSRNALKHGLLSRDIVLPGEDPAEWLAFRDEYAASLSPVGLHEQGLARRAAELFWRLLRIAECERKAAVDREDNPGLYLPDRMAIRHLTPYRPPAEPPDALPEGLPAPSALRPLIRYEAHLGRQFDITLRELYAAQDRRLGAHRVTRVEIHGYPNQVKRAPAAPPSPVEQPPADDPPVTAAPPPPVEDQPPSAQPAHTAEPAPERPPTAAADGRGETPTPKLRNEPPAAPAHARRETPPPELPNEPPAPTAELAFNPPSIEELLRLIPPEPEPRTDPLPHLSTVQLIDRVFEPTDDDATLDAIYDALELRLDDDAYEDLLYQLQHGRGEERPRFDHDPPPATLAGTPVGTVT